MKKPVKITLITVVVLAGVLVAADYGLAAAAEYQVSKKMKSRAEPGQRPVGGHPRFSVHHPGTAGNYSDITVNATGVPAANTLRDLEIDADLHNVRVPLSDLLSGNVSSVKVDEVDGQVQIKASDIGRLLGLADLTINPVSLDTVLGLGAQDAETAARAAAATPATRTRWHSRRASY